MDENKNWAYRLLVRKGWKLIVPFQIPDKCVICIAPHTSNWDFVYGLLFKKAIGLKAHFFMKKEWFRFPLGKIMRSVGGIPIDRSKKTSMTDQMAEEFKNHDHFVIGVTPEGTRKANPNWKKGFYFIATKAEVPIVLAYIDYQHKEIGLGRILQPSGDYDADIKIIKTFYAGVSGKIRKNFAI